MVEEGQSMLTFIEQEQARWAPPKKRTKNGAQGGKGAQEEIKRRLQREMSERGEREEKTRRISTRV